MHLPKIAFLIMAALFFAPFAIHAAGLLETVRIGGGAVLLVLNGFTAFGRA